MESSIKEALKKCKSVNKSDEILDDLFNSIKETKSGSDDRDSEADGSDESSDADKKKHKKSKKKKKKMKKKKKKHKRSELSDDSENDNSSKSKRVKKDSFWGNGEPFPEHGEVSMKELEKKKERRRGKEEEERGYYRQERHYEDERRPVDLGREARPFPPARYGEREEYKREPAWDRRGECDRDVRARHSPGRSYSRDRERHDRERYDREPSRRERRSYEREGEELKRRKHEGKPDLRDERRIERLKEKAKASYKAVDDVKKKREDEKKNGEDKKRSGDEEADTFWDTKWEGMKLDERLAKAEHKGQYYLNTKKRFKDATAAAGDKSGSETPSLSPSEDEQETKKKKKKDDSESDDSEFESLKKLRDIQNLKVVGDGLVEGPVPDTSNYEYDPVSRMYRKKDGLLMLEASKTGLADPTVSKEKPKAVEDENIPEAEKRERIVDELAKEIEELENEVDSTEKVKESTIDWGNSALGHLKDDVKPVIKNDEKVSKKKTDEVEDGEVDDGVEDGEVSSGNEKDRKKLVRESKIRRRSYSRENDSKGRSSRHSEDKRDAKRRSHSRDRRRRRSRTPSDRHSRRKYDRSYSPPTVRGKGRNVMRSRSRSRGRKRSPSRDRSLEDREATERQERNKRRQERYQRSKINKEKLLEIAKKNAQKILKSGGDFMGLDQDRLITMKAGGSNLDELTKFCKDLAKKGLEDAGKIEMLAESESESEDEFHHPFMVKDKPLPNPITMLIGEQREALPPAARAVAKSQRMLEYPVSSGNAHRTKEPEVDPLGDWKPVPRPAIEMKPDDADADTEMLKFHAQMEKEEAELRKAAKQEQEKAEKMWFLAEADKESASKELEDMAKPWTLSGADKDITQPKSDMFKAPIKELTPEVAAEVEKLKPKPSGLASVLSSASTPLAILPPPELSSVEDKFISSNPDKVFEVSDGPVVDIGSIVSQRLNAMRKLQDNPTDAEALKEMYDAQKQMTSWASSKHKPGQFVGSTGAKILSKHELNLGLQCWAKPEQFQKAEKVRGGFGEFMLKKMGWTDGEGLGKNKHGDVNPLTLDIKFDKKGLMAAEEGPGSRGNTVKTLTACKDLSGKHPISALSELCSKRRWGPPIFTQCFECGPPHKKQYVFKVNVNGQDYQSSVAVDNKKKAKANAALACLQQMGLVPKDPDNPV